MQIFPPHLIRIATLPCEIWKFENATDLDENVHRQCSSGAYFGGFMLFCGYLVLFTDEKIFTFATLITHRTTECKHRWDVVTT